MNEVDYRKMVREAQARYGDRKYNRFAEKPDPQPAQRDPERIRRAHARRAEFEKREQRIAAES